MKIGGYLRVKNGFPRFNDHMAGLCLRYLPRYYRVSNAAALLTPILFLGNERTRVTFGVTAILFEYRNSIGALLRYFVSIAKVSPRYCDTVFL